MLVVLSSLPGAAEAAQTVQRALAAASRPVGLRFALPEAYREAFDREDVLFYSGEESLEAVLSLLTDETHFLHLMGAHGFAPKWDARLDDALRHVSGPALLSASVSPPVEAVPAPVAAYILRFGFLKAVESLPLLLYTGGAQERLLRAGFPNTQSYPDNAVLPRSLMGMGMSPTDHFRRSKPLLMLRAASRRPEFTHAAWVDMDILPHPVCAEAVPSFSRLMDDRIHLATVDGVPDPSFAVVPVDLLRRLCSRTKALTQLDAELKRGWSEELLWTRLIEEAPDLFVLHPMPRRRLLFLTVFDPQLLGARLRALLASLPEPVVLPAPQKPASVKGGNPTHE